MRVLVVFLDFTILFLFLFLEKAYTSWREGRGDVQHRTTLGKVMGNLKRSGREKGGGFGGFFFNHLFYFYFLLIGRNSGLRMHNICFSLGFLLKFW